MGQVKPEADGKLSVPASGRKGENDGKRKGTAFRGGTAERMFFQAEETSFHKYQGISAVWRAGFADARISPSEKKVETVVCR